MSRIEQGRMPGHLPWAEVIEPLEPYIDLLRLVSTLKTSKSVLQDGLDSIPDQTLQQLLPGAVQNKPKIVFSLTPLDEVQQTQYLDGAVATCPYTSSISWLLRQCCKRWGIVSLAIRLDLQAALVEAKQDTVISVLFISAGARITLDLLLNHPHPQAPAQWFQAYQILGLSLDLPPLARTLCSYSSNGFNGMQLPLNMQAAAALQPQYLQQLSLQELLQYAKLTISIVPEEETCYALVGRLLSNFTTISPEQLLEVMVQAAQTGKYLYCLRGLLQTSLAQEVPGEGYAELLQAMSLTTARATTPGNVQAFKRLIEVVIRRATWSGGLVRMLACNFQRVCAATAAPTWPQDICMRCLLFKVAADGGAEQDDDLFPQPGWEADGPLVPHEFRVPLYIAALQSGRHHPSAPECARSLLQAGVGLTSSEAILSAVSLQLELKVPSYHIKRLLVLSAAAITPDTLLQVLQLTIAFGDKGAFSEVVKDIRPALGTLSLGQLTGLLVSGVGVIGSDASLLKYIITEFPVARKVPVDLAQQLISRCLQAGLSRPFEIALFLSALPAATVREVLQGLWPVVLAVDMKMQQQLLVHLVPIECSLQGSSCCMQACEQKLEEERKVYEHQQQQQQQQEDQQGEEHQIDQQQEQWQGTSGQRGQQDDHQQHQRGRKQCNVCTVLQEAGSSLPMEEVYTLLVTSALSRSSNIHVSGFRSLPVINQREEHQAVRLLNLVLQRRSGPDPSRAPKLQQLLEVLGPRHWAVAAVHKLMMAAVAAGGGSRGWEEVQQLLQLPEGVIGVEGWEAWEGELSEGQLQLLVERAGGVGVGECVAVLMELLTPGQDKEGLKEAV